MGRRLLPRAWTALMVGTATSVLVVACGGNAATSTPPPSPTARPTAPAPSPTVSLSVAPTPAPTPTVAPPKATPGAQLRYGGVLRLRTLRDWDSWDTYDAGGGFSVQVVANFMSNLVMEDPEDSNKIVPDVAERWDVSQDGKAITFFLRKDAKWHDGKVMTADDVLYNLNRGWKGTGKITFNLRKFLPVQDIQKVNDSTVRIVLSTASASFLGQIATVYVLMFPPHVATYATAMDEWKAHPVGSGPFKVIGWKKGAEVELARNPDYYKKDAVGRALPYLDGLLFYALEPATALAALRTGRIQCGCQYDADFTVDAKDTLERAIPGLKTWTGMALQTSLIFNPKRPPFDNRLVRQAFSAAVDRQELAKVVRNGLPKFPPSLLLPPELGGFWGLPESEMRTYPGFRDPAVDRAESQRLFQQAGIDPKTITIDYPITDFYKTIAEPIVTQLAQTGAKVNLRPLPQPVASQDVDRDGRFDVTNSTGYRILEPAERFFEWLTANGTRNPGKVIAYPEIERIVVEQDRTLDPVQRRALVYEAQRLLIREAQFTPTVYTPYVWATYPEVEGFVPPKGDTVGSHLRMERVWLRG